MRIDEFEMQYLNSQQDTNNQMYRIFDEIKAMGALSLEDNQVTKAILSRMKFHYSTQKDLMTFLNKRYKGASADYFVEAIIFYLKLLIETNKLTLTVESEKQVKKTRNALRPDISLWKNGELVAVIECKTQLGWSRNTWESEFLTREIELQKEFSNIKVFLLVLTEKNWSGFGQHKRLGYEYFVLSKVWPSEISLETLEDIIITPIERLFEQIKNI